MSINNINNIENELRKSFIYCMSTIDAVSQNTMDVIISEFSSCYATVGCFFDVVENVPAVTAYICKYILSKKDGECTWDDIAKVLNVDRKFNRDEIEKLKYSLGSISRIHGYNKDWYNNIKFAVIQNEPITNTNAIAALENRLRTQLGSSDFCGKAGMVICSTEDWALMKSWVSGYPQTFYNLRTKFQICPAIMLVTMAKLARDVYNGGFWEEFEEVLNMNEVFSPQQRAEISSIFQAKARLFISNVVKINDAIGMTHVRAFLIHGGLPSVSLDHFARVFCMMWDDDVYNASEDLLHDVKNSIYLEQYPFVLEALSGECGKIIIKATIRALIGENINDEDPYYERLRQAILEARQGIVNDRSRIINRPYIRFDINRMGIDIVLPYPKRRFGCVQNVKWYINDDLYDQCNQGDRVYAVKNLKPYDVKLTYWQCDKPINFNIYKTDKIQWTGGFCVFDEESKKYVPVRSIDNDYFLPVGRYLILHPEDMDFGVESNETSHDNYYLSYVNVNRNASIAIKDGDCEVGEIKPEVSAYFLKEGKVLRDHLHRCNIYYAWEAWPKVAVPPNALAHIKIKINGDEVISSQLDNRAFGEYREFTINLENLPNEYPTGLNELVLESRVEGQRKIIKGEYLYWSGLTCAQSDGSELTCSKSPSNLKQESLKGYVFKDGLSYVFQDPYNGVHSMSFRLWDGRDICIGWYHSGVTLKTVTRLNGRIIKEEFLPINSSLCRAQNEDKEIFVTIYPSDKVVIRINNGEAYKTLKSDDDLAFIKLDLRNLESANQSGAYVTLINHVRGKIVPYELFNFSSPCSVFWYSIQNQPNFPIMTEYRMHNMPQGVRLILKNLVNGEQMVLNPVTEEMNVIQQALNGIHIESQEEELLDVEEQQFTFNVCQNKLCNAYFHINDDSKCLFQLDLGEIQDWVSGAWSLFPEIRMTKMPLWQKLCDEKGVELKPIVVVKNIPTPPEPVEELIIWVALCNNALEGYRPNIEDIPEINTVNYASFCRAFDQLRSMDASIFRDPDRYKMVSMEIQKRIDNAIRRKFHQVCIYYVEQWNRSQSDKDVFDLVSKLPSLLELESRYAVQLTYHDVFSEAYRYINAISLNNSIDEMYRNFDLRLDAQYIGHCLNLFQPNHINGKEFINCVLSDLDINAEEYGTMGQKIDWILGKRHLHSVLSMFERRNNDTHEDLGAINGLLARSRRLIQEVKAHCAQSNNIMSAQIWQRPWPEVHCDGVAIITNVVAFASVLALSIRLNSRGMFGPCELSMVQTTYNSEDFDKVVSWTIRNAPEVLAFFLIFWELSLKLSLTHNKNK